MVLAKNHLWNDVGNVERFLKLTWKARNVFTSQKFLFLESFRVTGFANTIQVDFFIEKVTGLKLSSTKKAWAISSRTKTRLNSDLSRSDKTYLVCSSSTPTCNCKTEERRELLSKNKLRISKSQKWFLKTF